MRSFLFPLVALTVPALTVPAVAAGQGLGPPAPTQPRIAKATAAEGVSKSAPVNGVLVLYGNERCPTNGNNEEIVVCVRRSAAEQFRIPKELREFEVTPENASWAVKEQANRTVGNTGVGTCTAVGAAGATGCNVQDLSAWKRERQAAKKAETPDLP